MGRELKRVAIGFEWPLNKVWKGYINPYYIHCGSCLCCNGNGEIFGEDCVACNGSGELWTSDEAKKNAYSWVDYDPPVGDGYQIWETVSEGSPISPVFSTAEDLALYMTGRPWGADMGSSCASWMKFILGSGWSLSMVGNVTGIKTGPEACA